MNKKNNVLASPFIIIAVNLGVAYFFGNYIGKWAFVPMVLIRWKLWIFFMVKYGGVNAIKKWLDKPKEKFVWNIPTLVVGLIPLPIFLLHNETLGDWQIWLPWILLALINPSIEEFYWRGLLLDYTKDWPN
jgi:membrane protease YdiL (CAAX protease family)